MQTRTAGALAATITLLVALVGCDRSGGTCSPIGITEKDSEGRTWICAENLNTGKGFWCEDTQCVPDSR